MLILFLITLVVILISLLIKTSRRPMNYPPGPFCFPLIGNWYCVPGQGIQYKVAEWRKKYGNIIGLRMGCQNLVVIAGYKETLNALKNNHFQSRHRTINQTFRVFYKVLGLFIGDGEQYTRVRQFTVRFLAQVPTAQLESVIHEEMMNLFSTIKSGSIKRVDGEFMSFITNTLFTFLIGNSIKFVRNEVNTLRELVETSFQTGRISGIENFYPWLRIFYRRQPQYAAAKYVTNFFWDRLKEHRHSFDPENIRDYIDAFLLEQEKEKEIGQIEHFTDKELIACLLDVGQSSTDSTSNTAAFLLMYVALNPRVQDEMHKELDSVLGNRYPAVEDKSSLPYCNSVIKETMRISAVAATAKQHAATEDTKFYGYTIPKGTMIIFPFWDMFRNPDEFDDPDSFKPERFASKEVRSKVISFGVGKRSCVAELIVKKILFLTVTHFFQKYSISLPSGCKHLDTEPLLGFTSSPKPSRMYKISI